jgi:hypothetical protein
MENLLYTSGNIMSPYVHSNASGIKQIIEWKTQGFKVNVFIGKTPSITDYNRDLPKSESNEKWISLSLEYPDSDYYLNSERVHLVLDCNKTEDMDFITGLFDKVAVDTSVTKGFDNSAFLDVAHLVDLGGTLILPELVSMSSRYSLDLAQKRKIPEFGYFCVMTSLDEEKEYRKKNV